MIKFIVSQRINFLILLITSLIYLYFIDTLQWKYFIGESKIFGDYKSYVNWIKCDYLNYDIYKSTECDFFGTNYGPALFFLPFNSTLEFFYLKILPYLTIFFFLSACIFIINPKTGKELFITFILLVNPTTFLIIERLNFDIYIFLMSALIIYNRFYILNWVMIIYFGLVKIYPFILGINIFTENNKRGKKQIIGIIFFFLIISLSYIYLNLDKYMHVITNHGGKAGLHLLFSIKALPKIIKYLFEINYVVTLPLILLVTAYLFKININKLIKEKIEENINFYSLKTKLFISSGVIIVFCFLTFSNYLYREVFFILLIPMIFEILRTKDIKSLKNFLNLIIIKIIFLFIYCYFNVHESTYHLNDVRFYSNKFLVVSIIKGLLDLIIVSYVASLLFVIIKKNIFNK